MIKKIIIITIFCFALISSVFNVYATDDTEPTEDTKVAVTPLELITEPITEYTTEILTENVTENITEHPTEDITEEYSKIENQSAFSNLILIMILVVSVIGIFIRFV